MSLTLRRDLDRRNVAFDHNFIFEGHSLDFRALITRYRGTTCTPSKRGTIVTAWQRSIYRFGGFPLEETLVATIMVRHDGIVHGMSMDDRSHGGLGQLCDFRALQNCMNRTLRGRSFAEFSRACPTAGDAQCLHLFEVLSAAASFYAHMRAEGLAQGSEEELLNIYPKRDAITAVDQHWVLGEERETELTLLHRKKPQTTIQRLPKTLDSLLRIRHNGEEVMREAICAEDFREVYGQMNRALAKFNRVEKADFRVKGRMRFTNATAFVGLMLLTLAHESMHAFRAIRIGWMLHYLQVGGERPNCIAFCALEKTYQKA